MTYQTTARWGDPVDPQTFRAVGDAVDSLYSHDQFQEAYDLMEKTWPGLPDGELHPSRQDCVLFKAYLLARLGRAEQVLETVQSMLHAGYTLRLTWPGFDLVRELPGYAELEKEMAVQLEEEKSQAVREINVILPESYDSASEHPLCLLLHGDGEDSAKLRMHWPTGPLLERGYIVAFVQSSQLVFTNRYAWLPDPEVAWKDIQETVGELTSSYPIDGSRTLVCGFSGGAITAVDLVFGEAIPAAGFISLCPEYKPAHFTPETVKAATERGVRGTFLEGSLVWPLDDEQEMMDCMQSAGFPIQLILNEDMGHVSPPDFDGKLERALRFVLDE